MTLMSAAMVVVTIRMRSSHVHSDIVMLEVMIMLRYDSEAPTPQ